MRPVKTTKLRENKHEIDILSENNVKAPDTGINTAMRKV